MGGYLRDPDRPFGLALLLHQICELLFKLIQDAVLLVIGDNFLKFADRLLVYVSTPHSQFFLFWFLQEFLAEPINVVLRSPQRRLDVSIVPGVALVMQDRVVLHFLKLFRVAAPKHFIFLV